MSIRRTFFIDIFIDQEVSSITSLWTSCYYCHANLEQMIQWLVSVWIAEAPYTEYLYCGICKGHLTTERSLILDRVFKKWGVTPILLSFLGAKWGKIQLNAMNIAQSAHQYMHRPYILRLCSEQPQDIGVVNFNLQIKYQRTMSNY